MSKETLELDSLRNTPLELLLKGLGAEPDPKDKHNWRTPVGRITVTGPKFYNHDAKIGGGGAIDLVMHLRQVDFREAVRYLVGVSYVPGAFRADLPPMTPENPEKKSQVPFPVSEHWGCVREYLTGIRQISGALVDFLHQEGVLYADKFKNAVFLSEERKGAELRGTGPISFHGYRGEKSPFRIDGFGRDIAFVESAIDAMSLRDLGFSGTILSFGGCAKGLIQRYGCEAEHKGLKVWGAFDNDQAGETFFDALKEANPGAGRIRPKGKDWNEELLSTRVNGFFFGGTSAESTD